jgi:hypothetical protein
MNTLRRTIPALALGLVVVACGQDAPTPTASPDDATPTPSSTATASASASPSPDQTTTPGAGAPAGWRRIGVAEQGFSLAVPDGWQELSPALLADSGAMDDLREANPDAVGALEQAQAAIEQGDIALFAFDTDDERLASGFASNLNAINVGPVDGSAEEAATEVAEAIRQQIPITGEVETETAVLPAGDAAVLRYEWEITDADGAARSVSVAQYAIIGRSGSGFILSMSAASDAFAEYEPVFVQIAESFREES